MPKTDLAALILRGRDLFWCLAFSDIDDVQGDRWDRWTLLDGLRALEIRSQRLGERDLYSAIVRDVEAHASRRF